jgi:hypothetical protein
MKRSENTFQAPGQPALSDLLARYLKRQATDHAEGLATEAVGEVVPYEAAPVQPVDARLAWEEAVRVVSFYSPSAPAGSWQVPPHWPQLVTGHEPVMAVPFCAGNYPQMVRNFQPLLQKANLAKLRPLPGRPVAAPALLDWANQIAAKKQFPQTLLALGALRLAKQLDQAGELLTAHQAEVPAGWRAGWANETAALAWHGGRWEEAFTLWQSQDKSVPVLFNRGMAALFLDQAARAKTWLAEAVSQLPESGPWHHLGQLYLKLAESRT